MTLLDNLQETVLHATEAEHVEELLDKIDILKECVHELRTKLYEEQQQTKLDVSTHTHTW